MSSLPVRRRALRSSVKDKYMFEYVSSLYPVGKFSLRVVEVVMAPSDRRILSMTTEVFSFRGGLEELVVSSGSVKEPMTR